MRIKCFLKILLTEVKHPPIFLKTVFCSTNIIECKTRHLTLTTCIVYYQRDSFPYYFLTIYHMPNWNSNEVTIHTHISDVMKFIISHKESDSYSFNMHKIFPKFF